MLCRWRSTVDEGGAPWRRFEAGEGDLRYDPKFGGFGSAPKFPRPVELCLLLYESNNLLRQGREDESNKNMEMVAHTLQCMARGGIHDHLGGGFHRYSVDECWHVPHFEKMLYDQGQLANVYLDTFTITKDVFYSSVARDILDYIKRDMIEDDGQIFSADDADSAENDGSSKKKEGAFYVWTSEEVEEVLEIHAELFKSHYYVKASGNCDLSRMSDPHKEFKGKNVLFERKDVSFRASKLVEDGYEELTAEAEAALTNAQKTALREARKKDKKVLFTIYQGVDEATFDKISEAVSSKEAWEVLQRSMQGVDKAKKVKLQSLRGEYEMLRMQATEKVGDFVTRLRTLTNEMKRNGETIDDVSLMEKLLRSMSRKFRHVVVAIEESKDLTLMTVDELVGSLQAHEYRIMQDDEEASGLGKALQNQLNFGESSGRGGGQRAEVNKAEEEEEEEEEIREETNTTRERWNNLKEEGGKMEEEEEEAKEEAEEEEPKFSVTTATKEGRNEVWYLDTRASNHMCGDKEMFSNLEPSGGEVIFGDASKISLEGKGLVVVKLNGERVHLNDVYYVPGLKTNILSIEQLVERGYCVQMKDRYLAMKNDQGKEVVKVNMTANRLFTLKMDAQETACLARTKEEEEA
ncbi:hypothetical protein KSP40_PGU001706 [Platanthera guangdongensis]|uniref:Retrovirus-related Pol polyprotein from transposon TNT 1-94-like beta-barrel domain-containing protein n=1 Tax=Platanthera guangdongensis TaxID=2320717 RepID=A0ABR2MA98_9ASPA